MLNFSSVKNRKLNSKTVKNFTVKFYSKYSKNGAVRKVYSKRFVTHELISLIDTRTNLFFRSCDVSANASRNNQKFSLVLLYNI